VSFGCLVNGLGAAVLFNWSLTRLEAPLVSLFTYLEPLTAAVLGVVLLGDPFGASGALGASLVIVSGAWAAFGNRPTENQIPARSP
jgi:drug/metabolite transporter, DME family